jgi:hypothetical protein
MTPREFRDRLGAGLGHELPGRKLLTEGDHHAPHPPTAHRRHVRVGRRDRDVGEVTFRLQFGEGGRPLPQPGPEVAVVRLQRLRAGWWVLGVSDRDIRPDTPARLQRISSPLTVAGWAEVYEGTVYVKVTQDRPGRDLVLGQGFVTGDEAGSGRFRGQIRFRQPTGKAAGWVIFYEESMATGGGLLQATAVRVQFTAPAPRILAVTTNPRLVKQDGWLVLPKGAGTVVFSVKASDAQRVRFLLTPTGTGTARYTKLLGTDTMGSPCAGGTPARACSHT